MKIYRSDENDILMNNYHAHFLPFDLENDKWQFTEKQLHHLTQILQHQTLLILQNIGVSIKIFTEKQVG